LSLDAAQGDSPKLASGESVSAGRGLSLKVGVEIPNNESKTLFSQFFAGYKTSHGPFADAGEHVSEGLANLFGLSDQRYATLTRYTLDALEQYRFLGNFRLGVGATYHFHTRLKCIETQEGACSSIPQVEFDNAWGSLIQLSHVFGDLLEAGLRYTHIDYKTGSQRLDASGWGLFVALHIPLR